MTSLVIIIGFVVSIIVAIGFLALLSICWAASGCPDVNGDPERDAGMDDDDLAALSASWDRGSRAASQVPDLETARQLNRLRMARDVNHLSTFNRIHPYA